MTVFINSYLRGSKGAFRLKEALVARRSKVFISNREPRFRTPLLLCWGNSDWDYDPRPYPNVVNHPAVIPYLSHKGRFFNRVGHSGMVPEWTTDAAEAAKWEGKVFVRHKLEGSGGAGIEVLDLRENPGIPIPHAPLYVKHFPKTHEFRVHVARGLRGRDFAPILVQRKIFQKTAENPAPRDWNIRNHANGFIFVRDSEFPTPPEVTDLAVRFMTEHFPDLHFAALDVLFHLSKGVKKYCVLEGNTAPGLEGNTVEVYADYVHRLEKEAYAHS